LPFQTVETVNESAQERQRTLDLFSAGHDSGWRNRLIWGDKKYVLPALLKEFAGKVDLVYIDPPFATGQDFSFMAHIPDSDVEFVKEPSVIEQKAYRDTWGGGVDSYLTWFYETMVLLHELLASNGSIFVHLDETVGHYGRAVLDEVFGKAAFRNHIIVRSTFSHADAHQFGSVHQALFWYSKGDSWSYNKIHVDYEPDYVEKYYRFSDPDGRRWLSASLTGAGASGGQFAWKGVLPPRGRHWAYTTSKLDQLEADQRVYWTKNGIPRLKQYFDEMPGMPASDVWWDKDCQPLLTWTNESVGYPTQKPEALLRRVLGACSNPGDLVLDCFCGSGTTAVVADNLHRRWIAADLGRFAIHTTRKRLLSAPNVSPFVVQNLGKYERQLWQQSEFGETNEARTRAYRTFILDVFKAQPIAGYLWLHGSRHGRLVHVGTVDAPVTVGDIKQIAAEFRRAVGSGKDAPTTKAIDVLGWDFAFELNEVARQEASRAGIEMHFWRIPREILDRRAVEQGDVRFFELASLAVALATEGSKVEVSLTDFIIPLDDVPDKIQQAISDWSQWIDYWAVDWDNRSDTFHNEWQTYRTPSEPGLQKSAAHEYAGSGQYRIVVKVIDILGNDTTKTLTVEVR
jgi:DNA modification methylase